MVLSVPIFKHTQNLAALKIQTETCEQIVQALIQERADQGLHC